MSHERSTDMSADPPKPGASTASHFDALVDSLASSFASSVQAAVSSDGAAFTHESHPRFRQYKPTGSKTLEDVQQRRRKELLEKHKEARFDAQMRARAVALQTEEIYEYDVDVAMEEDEIERDIQGESMDVDSKSKEKKKKKKQERPYANQLMFSEWLVHIPQVNDFAKDWVMKPTPKGKRCLVVAAKGTTKAYNKHGVFIREFYSVLPGGGRSGKHEKHEVYTLLDCIMSYTLNSIFILDVIAWAENTFYDCDTDFRFFWISMKCGEVETLGVKSKNNSYAFRPLPHAPCSVIEMTQQMRELQDVDYEIDGLLFYHRLATYKTGVTPLVGWLKPFMLPEILNVPVADKFKTETKSADDFINAFDQLPARKFEVKMLKDVKAKTLKEDSPFAAK